MKYAEGVFTEQGDVVVREHRSDIYINGGHYISLMCLPQHLDELAVGFLFSEGIIRSFADVVRVDSAGIDEIYVTLRNTPDPVEAGKRVLVSGFAKGSVNQSFFETETLRPSTDSLTVSAEEVINMAASFSRQSVLFRKTGAVHSCALRLPDGKRLFYEDVGRHNALDKIIGKALIDNLDIKNGILLASGRISSEMLMKAAGLGIPVLISISAPTDKAVELAGKINMTLIGFARGGRFNVYAGGGRLRR